MAWTGPSVNAITSSRSQDSPKYPASHKHTQVWRGVSPEAKDLVSQLLVVDPSKRLTATEALRHPFLAVHCDKEAEEAEEAEDELPLAA